jgi:NAD(P)H-dependent FMN reductase
LKLAIVTGSHRPRSESARVAGYIEAWVQQNLPGFDSTYVLDLGRTPLPLWDDDLPASPPESRWSEVWPAVSDQLAASDGIVFVVPEWSGMAPAALKNLLLLCDKYQLAHKPVLIIGISSGMGGAYPAAELRATSSKDTMICYTPTQVIIRQVKAMLHGPVPQNPFDASIRERLAYELAVLVEYARALAVVRSSGVIDHRAFPYGM